MRPACKRYLLATSPSVLVVHLKRFQQIAKTHLIMDWRRGGRIGLIMRKPGRGGRGRRGVCIGCMLLRFTLGIWCVSFRLFFLFLGLMVYYSLEAITLRTLRCLLNHPVGRQQIHKDGQSLNPMENGATSKQAQSKLGHKRKGSGRVRSTTVRLTTLK